MLSDNLQIIYTYREANYIARMAIENISNKSITDILVNTFLEIDDDSLIKFNNISKRLLLGEPIQYVIGEHEFFNLKLIVNKNVLIPRPETEELVDIVLKNHLDEGLNILDIGTGSGCIALALKKHLKNAKVFAIDVSQEALNTACKNAEVNKLDVNFSKADILHEEYNLPQTIDIVISNPPYIPPSEKNLMHKNVTDFEPNLALFVSEDDPIIFYKRILKLASKHQNKKMKVYFELNDRFCEHVVKYAHEVGFSNVQVMMDLQGKNRFLIAYK